VEPGGDADAYVVPVRDLRLLGDLVVPPLPGGPLVIAYGPPELLRGAFLAGCDDYLKEPWAPDELETRLLKLAWGDEARRPAQGEYELEGRRVRFVDGREVLLSAHEAVVASLLLANRGAVVSRRALSFALWGRLPQRPSRAIDVHVSALRRKLGRVSISCVRGQGYLVD
jgi:DNA-binding response OmpR family regulator